MRSTNSAMPVNVNRVRSRIEKLTELTEENRPYTRRAFTDIYQQARKWLADEFRAASLEPRIDAGGNLLGVREGQRAALPALGVGSHIDTVPSGGRFDGIAGVIAALEAANVLSDAGVKLHHPLWVVDFLSEEPSDYGASCVGSRALAGTLNESMLKGENPDGEMLSRAIERMGGDPDSLRAGSPLIAPGELAGFMELHIEQGPVLERLGKPIGVVEGIVGIQRILLTVEGEAAHAGTTPMNLRRDALVGASRVVQLVSETAQAWAEAEPFVATIGRHDVYPNGANVVPGKVEMILEARALDDSRVERFLSKIQREASEQLEAMGLKLQANPQSEAAAVRCDTQIQEALIDACKRRGHNFERMSSGAGHDAMQVAQVAPVGMIFIPCKDGISHNPAEDARLEDVAAGAEVLLDALLDLDGHGP